MKFPQRGLVLKLHIPRKLKSVAIHWHFHANLTLKRTNSKTDEKTLNWLLGHEMKVHFLIRVFYLFIYLFVYLALSVQLKRFAYQQLRADIQVCFLTTQCSRYNIIHLLVQYKLFCMKQNYVDFSYNRHAYCLLKLEPKWETFENFWIWVLLEGSAQIQV